jgi:hypothetical protein
MMMESSISRLIWWKEGVLKEEEGKGGEGREDGGCVNIKTSSWRRQE